MMVPPMQPVLQAEQLLLRPMVSDDFDALFAVAADKEIWALHPAHDRWQEPVFRKFFDDALASCGALVVIDTSTGQIIGSSRYDKIRVLIDREVEIGWTFLARAYWGGATNRIMKRLMLSHAFDSGYDSVVFFVGESNLRSRRALEKIGAVLTERTHATEMAGKPCVHVVYQITPEMFATGPLLA